MKTFLMTILAISALLIIQSLTNVSAICSIGPEGASLCAGADFNAVFDTTSTQNTDFSRIIISGPPDKILSIKVLDNTSLEKMSDMVTIGSNGQTIYAINIKTYSYGKYQVQVNDGISIIKLDFPVGPTNPGLTLTSSLDKATLLIYTNVNWKANIQTSGNSTSFNGITNAQYSFTCAKNDTYNVSLSLPPHNGKGMWLWTVANIVQDGQLLNVGVNTIANGQINLSGKCHVAQFPLSNNGMVYFTTDRPVYRYGEPIQISGYILPELQKFYVLSSTVINSEGIAIKKDSTNFGIINTFNFNVNTHGGLWKPGKYRIVLEIAGSKAETSIVINSADQKQSSISPSHIPVWFKGTAKKWSEGMISDPEFIQTVQYLMQKGILKVPYYYSTSNSPSSINSWMKTSALTWFNGKMSDDDFLNVLKYFNFR